MINKRKNITIIMFFLMGVIKISAVWVDNEPFQYTQPDSTLIDYFVTGDEFYRWGHDEEVLL